MNRAREALTTAATFALALILAVVIWTTASEAQDPVSTRFLETQLVFVGLPANSALVEGDDRHTVQIRLEGPDSIIQELTPEDFAVTADLSQVPSGAPTTVDIDVTALKPGADISFITPEQVEVLLEQQVTREIPIELDVRGSVARGHTDREPLIEPPSIRVSGPASRVSELDFALVTVFLNNTVETFVETAQPIFYDQSGRVASVTGLDVSRDDVTVTIPVEESAGFADKLITVEWTGEPAPGYRLLSVTADPPSVLVEGRPAQVNNLTTVVTEPIDINGLAESFDQTAVLALPDGISVDPEQTVTVHIQIEPILTTSTFNRVPVPRGLRTGYEAAIEPEQVRVVLFGPLPALDAISENDVRVTVDLFGLEEGEYSIVPDVAVPGDDIEIRSVQPAAVSVTITETLTTPAALSDVRVIPVQTRTESASVAAAPVGPVGFPALCRAWPSAATTGWESCGWRQLPG